MNEKWSCGPISATIDPARPGRKLSQRGVILVTVLSLLLITMIVVGMLLSAASWSIRSSRNWIAQDECMLAADSMLERTKADIFTHFLVAWRSDPLPKTSVKFQWFNTTSSSSVGASKSRDPAGQCSVQRRHSHGLPG